MTLPRNGCDIGFAAVRGYHRGMTIGIHCRALGGGWMKTPNAIGLTPTGMSRSPYSSQYQSLSNCWFHCSRDKPCCRQTDFTP
jgi:hypothetical protein